MSSDGNEYFLRVQYPFFALKTARAGSIEWRQEATIGHLWSNVEWRHRLTGEFLHVAVLGMTAFADTGRSWGALVGPSRDGWRADIGVGLLLEVTRAAIVKILRFEIAIPDRGGKPVYQITTQSLF